ncbi:MAG: Uncharacterised protein [Prochlorococcus marinus str. MIT 9313]|nr:MAG: Uncharacterised protein [Prochlorococcus marinus str. MIT 9313]
MGGAQSGEVVADLEPLHGPVQAQPPVDAALQGLGGCLLHLRLLFQAPGDRFLISCPWQLCPVV